MGFLDKFGGESGLNNDYQQNKHKPEVSHELLGGAAAFYAAHEYEKHCEKNGQPQSHALAKEMLAGFAGAFIDREVETRGRDFVDAQKAKHEAKKRAERGYDEHVENVEIINEYN